jgi:hypothetical protein
MRTPAIVYFRSTIKSAWGDPTPESGQLLGPHPTLPDRVRVYAKTVIWPKGAVIIVPIDQLVPEPTPNYAKPTD